MTATTSAGDVLGRGMAFPPRVGVDGRIAWSEGETNIREAIRIVLMTAPGERIRRSAFGAGLEQFLYEPNTTTTRRSIESVDVEEDPRDPASATATVTFRIVATGAIERVSASISLGG